MPNEARAKAVEAAAGRLASDYYAHVGRRLTMRVATRMTERALDAMAEAGWVMARDVGEMEIPTIPTLLTPSARVSYANGWNACRAEMLKGAADEHG